jgi:hypothetical protein
MESRRLSIPIYLNQRIVFDLLAIVEGGFSQLQTIKTSESNNKANNADISAELGSKNVFAFLNLGLKASQGNQNIKSSQKDIEEERVFTPASLFSKLRDKLQEQNLLVSLDEPYELDKLQPGTFVEFSGILRKNPMVGNMEAVVQMMEVAMVFTKVEGKKKPKNDKEELAQMKKCLSMLTKTGSLDLIANLTTNPEIKAVIPVQTENFLNESPADIIDGQFVVLGKIVRYIPMESDEAINLLRGTPLANLPEENLQEVKDGFNQMTEIMADTEPFATQIKGPVLLVIPLAIYA